MYIIMIVVIEMLQQGGSPIPSGYEEGEGKIKVRTALTFSIGYFVIRFS